MRIAWRCLKEYRQLWRLWLVPVLLIVIAAPIVLALPLIEKQLIDNVLLAQRLDLLPVTIAAYSGLWLVTAITQVLGATFRAYFGERLTVEMRRRLFAHSEALSLAFSRREHSGRTMSLFMNDVPNVTGFFSATLVMTIGNLVVLVIGAVVMFQLNWELALAVVVAPPLIAGMAAVFTRPLRAAARLAQDKTAELNQALQESLVGMREIAAFGQERLQALRFTTMLQELLRLRMRLTIMDSTIRTGQSVFSLAVMLAIMGYGGYLVVIGQTTLGTLIAMQGIFGQVYQPALSLVGLVSTLQRILASVDRIYEFIDETPVVQEREGAHEPLHVSGSVAFEQVSFAYHAGRPVLRDVTFITQPGELVALVGPSGAGKSTLASLIARFYDPSGGRVLLDGVDIRDLTLEGVRRQIGMVFQDTFLFATTIRENVAFGTDHPSEAEIVAALQAANAMEFIEQLPQGLDTQVGERGVQFSEGQKQRLAIARALLRDPHILILDEPTSALDARSEHLLQSALNNLMRGRTTFVIAHRLATVQRADRILVLEHGRVVEQGTHPELLDRDGLYREFFELQFGGAPVVALAAAS